MVAPLPVTVKVAEAESPAGRPIAVIVYAPPPTFATVNPPLSPPRKIVQISPAMEPPENEQVVSLVEKRDPITVIVDPAKPEVGLRVIDGAPADILDV